MLSALLALTGYVEFSLLLVTSPVSLNELDIGGSFTLVSQGEGVVTVSPEVSIQLRQLRSGTRAGQDLCGGAELEDGAGSCWEMTGDGQAMAGGRSEEREGGGLARVK
jgi:hypothetical protein